MFGKEARIIINERTSFVQVGQNTEKSPGNLRSLVVTQTPVSDHHSTMM